MLLSGFQVCGHFGGCLSLHSLATIVETSSKTISDLPRSKITLVIIVRANVRVLWVILQIDNLCRMKLEVDVRKAMQQLSKDTLDHLYADSFGRIAAAETSARNVAWQAFSWLLCLRESLSPSAFVAAVAMANPERQLELTLAELVDICSNLIVLDSKLNILRFAHVSFSLVVLEILAMVQLLLAYGAKVNASGRPLHIVSARGHEAVVRTLLSHGAETERTGTRWSFSTSCSQCRTSIDCPATD